MPRSPNFQGSDKSAGAIGPASPPANTPKSASRKVPADRTPAKKTAAIVKNSSSKKSGKEYTTSCTPSKTPGKKGLTLDNTQCELCAKKDDGDKMLLCDKCGRGYHMFCLKPQLKGIPAGNWYCGDCIKRSKASSAKKDTSKRASTGTKKKSLRPLATAYEVTTDSDDGDLFTVKKQKEPSAEVNMGKELLSTDTPAAPSSRKRRSPSSTSKTKTDAAAASKSSSTIAAEHSMASETAKPTSKKMAKQSEKQRVKEEEDDNLADFKKGAKNHTRKSVEPSAEKSQEKKKKKRSSSVCKDFKAMLGEMTALCDTAQNASQDEAESEDEDDEAGFLSAALRAHEASQQSASCTQEGGGEAHRSSIEQRSIKDAEWVKDLTGDKRKKRKRPAHNSSIRLSDSESDIEERDQVLGNCYFPAKEFFQQKLMERQFKVAQFSVDQPTKGAKQDPFDRMMMRQGLGRKPLDAKEKRKVLKLVEDMLKEFPEYVEDPN